MLLEKLASAIKMNATMSKWISPNDCLFIVVLFDCEVKVRIKNILGNFFIL